MTVPPPPQPPAVRAEVPRHVAVIMDANGRWAEARGLARSDGHRAGTENIRHVIEAFGERGVEYLTVFAFSTENWKRPRPEVHALMRLLSRTIRRELAPLDEAGVRVRYIGRLEALDPAVRRQVEYAVEQTKHNQRMQVCVAFNYGGRAELVDAVRRMLADGLAPDAVDEATISRYLYTVDLPDPDLIIRTGGDQRLSNFLIWQAAYAEYYFTPTYWPDFGEADIDQALAAYAGRVRKFGGLAPTVAPPHDGQGANGADDASPRSDNANAHPDDGGARPDPGNASSDHGTARPDNGNGH